MTTQLSFYTKHGERIAGNQHSAFYPDGLYLFIDPEHCGGHAHLTPTEARCVRDWLNYLLGESAQEDEYAELQERKNAWLRERVETLQYRLKEEQTLSDVVQQRVNRLEDELQAEREFAAQQTTVANERQEVLSALARNAKEGDAESASIYLAFSAQEDQR